MPLIPRLATPTQAAYSARRLQAASLFVLCWTPIMVWAHLRTGGWRWTTTLQYILAVVTTCTAAQGGRWAAELDPTVRWPRRRR